MPNADRSRTPRPGQRQRARERIRSRASTPETVLESQLHQLFEEQHLLHNLIITHCPIIGLGRTDLIPEDFEGESLCEEEQKKEEEMSASLLEMIPKPEPEPEPEQEPETDIEQEPDKDLEEFNKRALKLQASKRELRKADEQVPPILAEDVTTSPPRLEDLSLTPPYSYNIPVTVGRCTPPKWMGQGFDSPFLYPEFIGKTPACRVKYIFTLVDSLVLQMESYLSLAQERSAEPKPIEKYTGAVPKVRSGGQSQTPVKSQARHQAGRARWAVSGDRSADRDSNLIIQSKPKKLTKRKEISQPLRVAELPLEIDLDCEFGMEHIEKFRANKVRDETRPEPALERAGNREDTPGEKVEKNEFGEGDKPQPGEGQARREYGEAGVVEQGMGRGQGQGDGHGDQQGEETSTSTGETEQGTSSEGTNGIGSGTSSSEYVNQNTDISSEYTPKSVDSLTSEWGQSPRPSTTTLTGDDNTSSEVGNGPTRPCSPDADYVPPELIPLFEGRANFDLSKEDASESSDVFRSLTEESVEEEVQPSTSAKARIIAARAKREKQKTAKRAKIWPKTVAVRGQRGGRPVKEQSIKLIPEDYYLNPQRCVTWGSKAIPTNKKFIGERNKFASFLKSYEDDIQTDENSEDSSDTEIVEKKEKKRCILYHEMEESTTLVKELKKENFKDADIAALNETIDPVLDRYLETRKIQVELSNDSQELRSLFFKAKKPKPTEHGSQCILQALTHTYPTPTPSLMLPEVPTVESIDFLAQNGFQDQVPQDQPDQGQRLKKLFMDKGRLKKKRILHSLATLDDPLQAVYLPKLEYRASGPENKDPDDKLALGVENPKENDGKEGDAEVTKTEDIEDEDELFIETSKNIEDEDEDDDEESSFTFNGLAVSHRLGRGKFVADVYSSSGLKWKRKRMLDKENEAIFRDKCIPKEITPEGDFRSHFELDELSVWALLYVGQRAPPGEMLVNHKRIRHYMEHFYRSRLITDAPHFQWFVNEGFLAVHYLLCEKSADELDSMSNKNIDKLVLEFIEKTNQPRGNRVQLTDMKAYYMVVPYFYVLYARANQDMVPVEERFLLRSRFAVFLLEMYFQELGLRPFRGNLNCVELLTWSLKHEGRVHAIHEEVLGYAADRAGVYNSGNMTMELPNLNQAKEFYERGILPRPDHLALNPSPGNIRRYPSESMDGKEIFLCPIKGCETDLISSKLMSHFITDHCRRVSEVWVKDRMGLFLYPGSYPPEQLYCLCVVALLPKGSDEVPRPSLIINAELPPPLLYFAEHFPCLLMYCQVSKAIIKRERKKKAGVDEAGDEIANDPESQLYVFWLASNENDVVPEVVCELYLHCRDRTVQGNAQLELVVLSRFKGIEDLVNNHPESYLAIDHPTMVSLTKNFKELLLVEMNYVSKSDYPDDAGPWDAWDE